MRVLVLYTGPDAQRASAFVIGRVNERNVNYVYIDNIAKQSVYKVFAPGKGVG